MLGTCRRWFVLTLGISAALFSQKQITVADCTFTAKPDEILSRAARARQNAVARVRTLAARGDRNLDAASVTRRNFIDEGIFAEMARRGAPAAPLSTDEEFLRRITLDLTGRLPEPADIRAFLADSSPAKRDKAIDRLLESPEFVDRWIMWMGDWLQNTSTLVNAAVNRGVNGRNAFHVYLKDAVKTNKPLSRIATEVLTAKGNTSGAETGAANFPLGASTSMGPVQDTYDTMLAKSASMFLGLGTYDCLLCHNGRGHLTLVNAWAVSRTRGEAQRMAAFFSRMSFTAGPARSFDVNDATAGGYDLNTDSGNRPDRTPVGTLQTLTPEYRDTGAAPADSNWRAAFAANLVRDPLFAQNMANRIWKQMFNLAMVDPVDSLDPARLDPATTPPEPWDLQATHPELFLQLAAELAKQEFNLRSFLRTLAQSSAYQLSSRFGGDWNPEHVTLFNRRIARRLEAEEVHDAIAKATGVPGDYQIQGMPERAAWAMQLPEPLEPTSNAPVAGFLNAFLRGDRDTQDRSQAGSIQQQLYLMNDAFVTERMKVDRSPRLQALAKLTSNDELLDELYLAFLSRMPSAAERTAGTAYLAKAASRTSAIEDLAWMCVNKVDFLFSY